MWTSSVKPLWITMDNLAFHPQGISSTEKAYVRQLFLCTACPTGFKAQFTGLSSNFKPWSAFKIKVFAAYTHINTP
jgi:hypothetical protein